MLLDGRRVTTHWARADQLASEFPAIEVDADPIYLRDGKCWTSAGVTAGIDLAAAACMSVRHFARVFTDEVGETPGRFVERVRLEAARREAETTSDPLPVVARRCGFGTAETLRRTFQRRLNVAPDSYRRRFGVVAHEGTPA